MSKFELNILGCRGSIPTTGVNFSKYGGNTSCISISTSEELIILDAGSGIKNFNGNSINKIHLFFTHYHWDHIQGFLFFKKLFDSNCEIHIYGPNDPKKIFSTITIPELFPISMNQIPASLFFHSIKQDTSLKIGKVVITTKRLNHPSYTIGYSIEYLDKKIAYVTDTEHFNDSLDINVLELSDKADILLYDSMYTNTEYKNKIGWGHSTWEEAIKIANKAAVKHLLFFHHDHEKNDATLDELEIIAQSNFNSCEFAKEGSSFNLL
ncbi:MBL fold metallo-hydrolase [Candidatus Marinamargulisbacteria bacterium SCGC AG-410-N11]|nr:MBL fold metallo-hydrolase [Candidatus Marinamargulisbacteria bacterium SCGC AG-410-N11]